MALLYVEFTDAAGNKQSHGFTDLDSARSVTFVLEALTVGYELRIES